MTKPLQYTKYDNDVFMLFCRAETPVAMMPDHPVILELNRQLDSTREIDERVTGRPTGPITGPSGWRGYLTIGTCRFRVKATYAFTKFFGIICDTEDGTHDSSEIKEFVDNLNATVAAELGVDGLR